MVPDIKHDIIPLFERLHPTELRIESGSNPLKISVMLEDFI